LHLCPAIEHAPQPRGGNRLRKEVIHPGGDHGEREALAQRGDLATLGEVDRVADRADLWAVLNPERSAKSEGEADRGRVPLRPLRPHAIKRVPSGDESSCTG